MEMPSKQPHQKKKLWEYQASHYSSKEKQHKQQVKKENTQSKIGLVAFPKDW